MSTPSSIAADLQALLALQVVDSGLDRLRAGLVALDSGASTAATYNTGKAEFDRRHAAMLKAQAEQHDAEMRLQSVETKTEQVNKQLYGSTAASARDVKNLQMELDMLGRQKGDAEEKVLVAMEATGEATNTAQTLETELTALADKYRGLRTDWKTRSAAINKEIAAGEADRATAAKPIPAPLLARYDAIRAKKGGIGAAAIDPDGTCGACHIKLSTGLIDLVRAARAPELCEHCARILVSLTAPA